MKKIALVFVLVLASITLSVAQKPFKLAYNMPVGYSFTLTQVSKTEIVQNMGMEIKTLQNAESVNSFKVVGVTDSQITFEMAYKGFKMSIQNIQMNSSYDAASAEPKDAVEKFLKAMLNKPFKMSIDKRGNVIGVEGLASTFEEVRKSMGELADSELVAIDQMSKSMTDEETFKRNMQGVFPIYPEATISAPGTWTYETLTAPPLNMASKSTIIAEKLSKKKGTFTNKAMIEPTTTPDYVLGPGNMEIKTELTGSSAGSFTTNNATGLIKTATSLAKMNGNISIKANAQLPQDMIIPCTYAISNVFAVK